MKLISKLGLGIVLNFLLSSAALAGTWSSGGGDLCEDRFKTVRDDIKSWIQKGGSKTLRLPTGVSSLEYSSQMLAQIARAKIKCVAAGDEAYPVNLSGTPKTCRFDKVDQTSSITCDLQKFQEASESDQYVLVHHEFAGLAAVELPKNDDSDYEVSNQVSEYLVDEVVKKLAVKPQGPAHAPVKGKHCEKGGVSGVIITCTLKDEPVPAGTTLNDYPGYGTFSYLAQSMAAGQCRNRAEDEKALVLSLDLDRCNYTDAEGNIFCDFKLCLRYSTR